MILIPLAVSWMVGIYISSLWALPLTFWGMVALLPLGLAWLWFRTPRARLAALCALFACLGAARLAAARPVLDPHSLAAYNDRGSVQLTGVVTAEPDVRDTYVNLRLRAESLRLEDGSVRAVHGLALVRAPRYPEYAYGDRLEVRGALETPPVFESFDYRETLARQGIYSLVRWARLTRLAAGQGSRLFGALLAFKRHAGQTIAQVLPEPCGALLTGILLGVDTGLPAGLVADFRTTGTSHIIAISGFNMALVSQFTARIGVYLVGRRRAAWFSTVAIVLYTVLVGGSAAVVRAAVMGGIGVWGEHLGRQNAAPNALLATALLMTAWNPHTLWDLGFLLSLAATLGLILLATPLQRRFEGLLARLLPGRWVGPAAGLLNESLVLTTCAQLTTMPIILYNFRTFSLVTLLSNLLVLPAQPFVMIWGALAAFGGLIWLPVGRILGWAAWLFLAYTIWAVEWTAALPYAAIEVGRVGLAPIGLWYALLGGAAWWMVQAAPRRRELIEAWRGWWGGHAVRSGLLAGAALAATLTWLAALSLPDGRLHVSFLDVGAGDAVWIETPTGRQVLVDGGPSGVALAAHLGRRMPFWDRTIDLLVLSDPDDAHVMGLVPLWERYRIDRAWYLPAAEGSAAWREWRAGAEARPGQAFHPPPGASIDLGDGVRLTVLSGADEASAAGAGGTPAGDEERPIVLRLDYGQTCFLLAGSAGPAVQQRLLAQQALQRCDVLQVPDHGHTPPSPAFLDAVRPALGVLSCDGQLAAARPDDETLARLAKVGATVARTDERGSIEIISDGVTYRVKTGR